MFSNYANETFEILQNYILDNFICLKFKLCVRDKISWYFSFFNVELV